MTSIRHRAAGLLFSAFAATAVLGLAAAPAQAAPAEAVPAHAAAADSSSSSSSPGLLGGLFGGGGLVTVFIGNYQVNN